MSSSIIPTVGMKVHAVVVGSDGDIVHGTITKVEQLIVEETNEVLSEHFPTITLDDGRIVNGMECWWSLVDDTSDTTVLTSGACIEVLKE